MKINKKVKDKIQDLLFEFRLGTEDMQPQQHIRYSMFDTPGPDTPGTPGEVEEEPEEIDVIKPSEISPIQLHSVVQNIDKVPDNVIELKNIVNHIFSKLGNNEITQEQITKIYNTILDVVGKD
jgi:hypothetical protein|tara:strand:- start:145 stop:513 length:369 start_codon:yes stop_codon:yes gene_type:complete